MHEDRYVAAQGTASSAGKRGSPSAEDDAGQVWVGGKTLTLVNGTVDT